MNIISVTDITKTYTERKLFEKASFYLQEREKVGVIGINGTGKSTLLKIAAGIEEPDEGQVIRANHIVVRYLPQNPVFDPELSVIDTVLAQSSQNFVGGTSEQNQNAGNHAEHVEHWNLESDAKAMMTKLGITDFEQKAGELSGGQRKRLALVAALLVPCDVLILDEPTNHLDSAMADWLEDFLKKWRGALIMVTHDRYFLDSVCNRIVEVDKGSIYSYDANYSGYLELKAEREEMQQASERKRQNILRKELEWIRRGAKARTTKQKGRIQRYEKLKDQDAPQTDGSVEISSISSRMGKTTVELSHISKSYDSRVLIRDFTYIFLKNDRIGFVGANGSGKTTLMKIIDQRIQPDEGTVTIGQTIKIGYYTQEIENTKDAGIAYMDPNEKVIDYIKNTAEFVRTKDGLVSASNMLERFLFPSSQQYSPIGKLSGGEKRRLNLLRVLMEAPNVLILDEPTNDLDIRTLTILEDYLDNYDGIAIKLSSPGPVFFKQKRSGEDGREFWCYKFRSMKVNTQCDTLQATENDPRKTRIGEIMRKTSVDELPQFINVLKGDMSIVGPRPHMLKHTEEYSNLINKFMVRHFVKPGITGWAQVTGYRGETKELWQMEGRVQRDIWYIEHWTFLLDLYIMYKTVYNAIRGEKEAY